MFLTSYIFKSKAVRALKGNWQTALIVAFLAGVPATVNSLLRSTQLPEISIYVTYDELIAAVQQIAPATIWLISIVGVLTFFVTPMLAVGCNHYFIKRIQGEDLGVIGVLSRRKLFFRSLILYLYMGIRIIAWSLLFIVPGILAALRYSMAPYFMAENPDLTPGEAINKSKAVMADKKLSYFVLLLSFVGWALMAMAVQIMMISFSVIMALVAYQFIELFRVTYMNASIAAFYLAASRTEGIQKAKQEADAFVKEISGKSPMDLDNVQDEADESTGGQEPSTDDDTEKEA